MLPLRSRSRWRHFWPSRYRSPSAAEVVRAVHGNSKRTIEARAAAGAIGTPRYRRSASEYSPATTLVGAIRGIDPSRNFEILHLSISGRPFTAQGTPAP